MNRLYASRIDKEYRELIEFFRNEGHRLGHQGDEFGWTPAKTAIVAMKELLKLEPMVALPQLKEGERLCQK